MSYWNRWSMTCTAPLEIFKKFQYKPALNGFGFEDYLWNCEIRASDIPCVIAPGTVIFYRRRMNSVTSLHLGTILDYSNLFEYEFIKSINLPQKNDDKAERRAKIRHSLGKYLKFGYHQIHRLPAAIRFLSTIAVNLYYTRARARVPESLIEAWRDVNSIENQLYPTKEAILQLKFHPLSFNQHNIGFGLIFQKLMKQTHGQIDYLFLAPHMSGMGGTEKLIGNYIRALKLIHPNWKIAILSTVPFNQDTIECKFFPDGVDFIDFGRLTRGLNPWEIDIIWSRFLSQTKAKRLHIVNDEYWYRWLISHEELILKNDYMVNISLFMREYSKEADQIISFSDPCLMELWPMVNLVVTDNFNVVKEALENNAFDESKFKVHYQPEDVSNMVKPKIIKNDKPIRVLWASRVCLQKRPDILKKIAEKLDAKDFQIDAYGHLQHYKSSFFDGTNITYKGAFSGGIKSLPLENYDVYLYTSATDGMPNILLEAVAKGLPIVASNAGGVGELIKNDTTGFLIDIEDINSYVAALKDIKRDPVRATKYAISAQELLKSRHSFESFTKQVAKDIN
jgi:glycosyltransferase involved in cell wall biosynthesis